jgi:hypothetical protein
MEKFKFEASFQVEANGKSRGLCLLWKKNRINDGGRVLCLCIVVYVNP